MVRKDDGDRGRGLLGGLGRWRGASDDDVDLEANQLGREGGESFGSSLRISALDDEVLALDVPQFPQPLEESRPGTRDPRIGRLERPEQADAKHLRRLLLRFSGDRRREDDQGEGEGEPSHRSSSSKASSESEWRCMAGIPADWTGPATRGEGEPDDVALH